MRMDIKEYFQGFMDRVFSALSQESTWRGIVGIATATGVTLHPELQGHIIAVGMTLIGIINVSKNK